MNFEQLTYFIAIVENDTYFNAAEYLHMSQSNLSKQIIKLENELAIDLFDRSYRSAVLTDAGRLFYNDALQLIDQYHKVLQHIDDYKKSNEQNLHIGTLPIQTQNPNIHISIDEVEEYDLIIGLNQDKYDIIIARENMINSKQYDTYPIAEDELVVVLPSSHKLAAHSTLDFNLLSGENFILMNPYTSIYKLCMQQIKKYNIDANIVGTARTESIIGAVSFNEGISLLPKSNFEIFNHKNVVNIPFTNPIRLSVVIAKKNTRVTTPALKKLIEFI